MKKNFIPVIIMAVILMFSQTAFAATQSANVNVTAGSLSVAIEGGPLVFNVTLTGEDLTDQTPATAPAFRVKNPGASGTGWNVTISCSDFTNGSNTIPVDDGSFGLSYTSGGAGDSLTKVGGSGAKAGDPTIESQSDVRLSSPVKILTADNGKGQFLFTPDKTDFTFDIANDVAAVNYTGTLTATIATGP